MKIIESASEMREYSQKLKKDGLTIGCVGTQGFLHEGHMSLVKMAQENCDVVVVDITPAINSLKCSSKEYKKELEIYKKTTLKNDKEICVLNKVNVFFFCSLEDQYLDTPALNSNLIESQHPTFPMGSLDFIPASHTTFGIVIPDVFVVGEKDLHQNVALKSLINRLGLPIKVVIAPTVRDPDGLAFSSRNAFLTKVLRERACSVYKSLQEVAQMTSYPSVKAIKRQIFNNIKTAHGSVFSIDIVCAETMGDLDIIDRPAMVCVSATFGDVYLWDNIRINSE